MNYLHIARLCQLADQISDKTRDTPRFDCSVEYTYNLGDPIVEVTLYSWTDRLSTMRFRTPLYSDDPDYTTADLVRILEQVESHVHGQRVAA